MTPNIFQRAFTPRILLTVLACSTLALAGCSGKYGRTAVQNDEGDSANAGKPQLVSLLKMNDPNAKAQLAKGFYGLESGTWRWTAGNFTVVLKTPPGAAQKGATLTLNLVASEAVLNQVHSQTLTASIGKTVLKTEKYADAGAHTFTADVPAASLTGDSVAIDFSLDNSLPPGPTDRRELGVIVTAADLELN